MKTKSKDWVSFYLTIVSILIITYSCKKEKETTLPVTTTKNAFNITAYSATSGGYINSDGGEEITAKGICWSVSPAPSLKDNKTSEGKGLSDFESVLSSLLPNTSYFLRSYATNKNGTSYGNEISLITQIGLPILSTSTINNITVSSAISGGTISSDGGAPITARGLCWSRFRDQVTASIKTYDGIGVGSFTSSMTNLMANQTYYVRAYATNSAGTTFAQLQKFDTPEAGDGSTATDIDGNIYTTVKIGTQIWMKENLKVTHYRNGDPIVYGLDTPSYTSTLMGVYYAFNNDFILAKTIVGYLYNFYAASEARSIAPKGWRVATLDDFKKLSDYGVNLSGEGFGRIKVFEDSSYYCGDYHGNNLTGFSAIAAGYRSASGEYINIENVLTKCYAHRWWTSTQVGPGGGLWDGFVIQPGDISYSNQYVGYSVRCIKD